MFKIPSHYEFYVIDCSHSYVQCIFRTPLRNSFPLNQLNGQRLCFFVDFQYWKISNSPQSFLGFPFIPFGCLLNNRIGNEHIKIGQQLPERVSS